MQIKVKFITRSDFYSFDKDGKHYEGYTVHAYDAKADKLIKCHSDKEINAQFGDEILVRCVPNGDRIKYEVA